MVASRATPESLSWRGFRGISNVLIVPDASGFACVATGRIDYASRIGPAPGAAATR
ncbi:MAG: hypothetical protein KJZ83_04190 [Burkholderiaceae bacterium]|nr:hypothetical protein [Burkholderiaceae bacterium]